MQIQQLIFTATLLGAGALASTSLLIVAQMPFIANTSIHATSKASANPSANPSANAAPTQKPQTINPKIDAKGFLAVSQAVLVHRENRRLSEAEFLAMSTEPNTIVLDVCSAKRFDELHIAGAKNLSFSDITAESLAQIIPNPNTRVLIYCNNNFANSRLAFPTKLPSASLNLSTFTALYNYGYRNVYELAPTLDAATTKLSLVASKGALTAAK